MRDRSAGSCPSAGISGPVPGTAHADAARSRKTAAILKRPWRLFSEWLRRAPIDDPVEQRNAPMVQVLLLVVGLLLPVMVVLNLTRNWDTSIRLDGEMILLGMTVLAWFCLGLVRAGRFRLASGLFIGGSLVLLGLAYFTLGLRAQLSAQIIHAYPMVLGGLLLGRRALWLIMATMVVIFAAGTGKDLAMAMQIAPLRADALSGLARSLLGFLVLAVILDRAVAALRQSLARAARRDQELLKAHERLEREMIERERSQAQLIHAQKVEAVGRLAGGVAHDFNNILGVILGYATRPVAREDAAVAARALDGIVAATRRGAAITQRLLSLSRSDGHAPKVFDAREAIRDTLPMIRQTLGDIEVSIRIDDDDALPVRLDPAEFQLALLNLAANARDAMINGGRFHIGAGIDDGGAVFITVTDNGIGMKPAVLERIFEPFFTTKPRNKGTGIGLAMVHRTITEAGGRIGVESRPGWGTTFRLCLPRTARTAMAAPPARAGVGQATARSVLLIEDDDELRGQMATTLREGGCRVMAAATAAQALAAADAHPDIDVVLTDFHLPDARADELLDPLSQRLPSARIVVVSSDGNAGHACCARRPAIEVVSKPLMPATLLALVRTPAPIEPHPGR